MNGRVWRGLAAALTLWCTVAIQPVVAAGKAWPSSGLIVYQVSMGNGPQVGEARHSWTQDGRSYRMQTEVRTVGMAALIKRMQYVQRSQGRVLASGLQPARFSVDREGVQAELAEFDWQRKQLTFTRKGRTREEGLKAGDQDVLSLWHQVGVRADQPLPARLQVVTGRKVAESTLEWVGAEELNLPLGRLTTRRLKARAVDGSMEIDVWFAPGQHMLPVRIRMVDDDGDVLDQQASEVRIGVVATGTGS